MTKGKREHAPAGYSATVVPVSIQGTHVANALCASNLTYFDWRFTNGGNAPALVSPRPILQLSTAV